MGFRIGIRIPLPGPFSAYASAPANLSGWRRQYTPIQSTGPSRAALDFYNGMQSAYVQRMRAWHDECDRVDAQRRALGLPVMLRDRRP